IMDQASLLQLNQCRQDTHVEVAMRTPKSFYAQQRIIYQPELLTCPHCGDLLMLCHYLAWNKTVQTLCGVLSVASRPGRCPHATCCQMDTFFGLGGSGANNKIHSREITEMLKATPQRFGPRVVTGATTYKATELRNPTHRLAQRGWTVRRG